MSKQRLIKPLVPNEPLCVKSGTREYFNHTLLEDKNLYQNETILRTLLKSMIVMVCGSWRALNCMGFIYIPPFPHLDTKWISQGDMQVSSTLSSKPPG